MRARFHAAALVHSDRATERGEERVSGRPSYSQREQAEEGGEGEATQHPSPRPPRRRTTSPWSGTSPHNIHKLVVKALALPAAQKLSASDVDTLTLHEVLSLFKFLRSPDHYIEVDTLIYLLRELYGCLEKDLEEFRLYLEVPSDDGFLSAEQVLKLMKRGRGHELLKELQAACRATASGTVRGLHVTRSLMEDKVAWRVHRDEAFSTLPLTLLYMGAFMALVIFHLRIWERQQLERGLQEYVGEFGVALDGPFLRAHVKDARSFFSWLEASGMPAVLGNLRNDSARGYSARVAVLSTVLGDIQLRQKKYDGSERTQWLLHSAVGAAHLQNHPGQFLEAATAACRSLQADGWGSRNTEELSLIIPTYNERHTMFTLVEVLVWISPYGHVSAGAHARAMLSDPYPRFSASVPLDVLFILVVLFMLARELHEVSIAARHSLRPYGRSVWNAIDWMAIVLGFVNCGLWISCCSAMDGDAQKAVWEGDSFRLRPNVMSLTERELDDLQASLGVVRQRFFVLHAVAAATTAIIIMRFFKAFESNQRLDVVARTFKSVYQDIVHFLIVFLTVFVCFALIGHVLFGCDVREFRTLGASINTAGMALMGDLGWYAALSDTPDLLPSGMPRFLVMAWFFTYMFFVAIVLLNMLLAIILDRYSMVAFENEKGDLRTLWSQTARFVRRIRDTRGFIRLQHLLARLQDIHAPAHQSETVTHESLVNAFQGMREEQADWLMTWLKEEAFAKETTTREPPEVMRLQRTQRLLLSLESEVQNISPQVTACDARLKTLQRKVESARSERGGDRGNSWSTWMSGGPRKASEARAAASEANNSSAWSQRLPQFWCASEPDPEGSLSDSEEL